MDVECGWCAATIDRSDFLEVLREERIKMAGWIGWAVKGAEHLELRIQENGMTRWEWGRFADKGFKISPILPKELNLQVN